jgi:ATP-dependent Clp protease ATP-binding subunit ClpC
MFERFTDRARRSVVLSQEAARELNHGHIGTAHALIGLLHEGDGIAAQVLKELGFTLEGMRKGVEEIVGFGNESPSGHIPYSPDNKKALERALHEALQLGHNFIGTEHLLLGLTRDVNEGNTAAVLLKKLGSSALEVRGATFERIHATVYNTGHRKVTVSSNPVDPELSAMRAVLAALEPLDEPTRVRVVTWVSARLEG